MLKANDKYNAKLSSGYTVGQNILNVTAVPDNVPTQIVAAKGTDNETVFSVTGKTTSTLTGVTRIKGANVDLDTQTPLTCLNNEEFINQFHEAATAKASGAEIDTGTEDAKIVTPKAIADSYLAGLWDGWIKTVETWSYASADDPTFTFTIAGDKTTKYSPGMRIKLTQTSTKYFIITKVEYSDPNTTVTVYGGTDYDLANAEITSPFYSTMKAPQGFPLDPLKWTVSFTNTSLQTLNTPTENTNYTPADHTITVPIGAWSFEYEGNIQVALSSVASSEMLTGVATTSGGAISKLKFSFQHALASLGVGFFGRENLVLTAKQAYYIILRYAGGTASAMYLRGDYKTTTIRAVSTYL
jgi:hypothetical protein